MQFSTGEVWWVTASSLAGQCPYRLLFFPFFPPITFQKLYKIKTPRQFIRPSYFLSPSSLYILSRCTLKVENGPGGCRMCECRTKALCLVQTDTKGPLSRQRAWPIAKAEISDIVLASDLKCPILWNANNDLVILALFSNKNTSLLIRASQTFPRHGPQTAVASGWGHKPNQTKKFQNICKETSHF